MDDDDIDELLVKVKKLTRRPRVLSLVSVTDGSSYTIKDDGGGYKKGEGFSPNGHRMAALSLMTKKGRDGKPVFYAAERIASSDSFDADISYKPKAIEAAFPGDPLAEWPVLDDAALARLHANVEGRKVLQAKSDKSNAKEILDVITTVAARMKADAPKIQAPKKVGPHV